MAALAAVPHLTLPFRNLGEQLFAVYRAGEASIVDPRLDEIQKRALQTPAGASELIPSDGGFLIQPTFSQELVTRVFDVGMLIKRMKKFAVKSSAFSFPQPGEKSRVTGSRLGGIQVYPENEAQSIQVITPGTYSQKPAFALSTIQMSKYTGLLFCTDELSMDSDAFGTWAEYCYTTEMAFQIEQHAVSGTGAGQLQGILSSPALITVPKQVGQVPATVIGNNVIDMVGSLWSASRNTNSAIWLYHQGLLPTLMALTIPVGSGGSDLPLWHFAESDQEMDTLAGIPAYPSEYCAAPGSTGDIVLADWGRYALGTREMRSEQSIHVLWVSDQSTFRFIWRVGGQLIDIAPVASANGSITTSTAIALAPR
jgi:HK97 family phage major capsid protein